MSRAQFSNDKYTFAFGVDHTPMGCFFQIWEKGFEDKERGRPQIHADEIFGLIHNNPETQGRNAKLAAVLPEDKRRLRSEETIIEIGKALGFDVTRKVYELWD